MPPLLAMTIQKRLTRPPSLSPGKQTVSAEELVNRNKRSPWSFLGTVPPRGVSPGRPGAGRLVHPRWLTVLSHWGPPKPGFWYFHKGKVQSTGVLTVLSPCTRSNR